MNKVSDITYSILLSDHAHLETLKNNTLNLRAYASKIQSQVESQCKKQVKLGSIVIALSRLKSKIEDIPSLRPEVTIEGLSVKSDLAAVTYEKTASILQELSKNLNFERRDKDFFVISEGMAEVTIVGPSEGVAKIVQSMPVEPKAKFENAVSVTVMFDEKYIVVPNVLYSFVSSMAVKRINLSLIHI